MIELLKVEECFEIPNQGLMVVPDFSVPDDGWEARNEKIQIEKPNGETAEAEAIFQLSHFNIRDSKVPMDKRWRVLVVIKEQTKDGIPVGSRLLTNAAFANKLKNKEAS